MIRLQGERIYLAALEKQDCAKLYEDQEEDFANPTDIINIGYSVKRSDEWFEEIQKLQHKENVRLGIFLGDGTPVGDVALQGLDWRTRSCSLGMGLAKLESRGKGYGLEAGRLMLGYAFGHLGLERVWANTLDINPAGRRSLEKMGFMLEGRLRGAEYVAGKRVDKLCYAILKEEFFT